MTTRALTSAADIVGLPKLPKLTARERELIMGDPGRGFHVPFGSLRIGDDNIRDALDTDIAGLARAIRRVGLLQPPAVEPDPDDSSLVVVVAGHRRFLALAALGLGAGDPVPVHYLDSGDHGPAARALRMLSENVDRANLTLIDEANTVRLLHETYGMAFGAIGLAMRLSAKTVAARLQLLDLPGDYAADVGTLVGADHAQRVGALVAAGAPAPVVDALWADLTNPERVTRPGAFTPAGDAVTRAEKAHRAAQAIASITAGLEARGVVVVTRPGQAPKKKGCSVEKRSLVPVDTPAALKAAPNAPSLNVDGRPVLLLETSWDSTVACWSLKHVKQVPRPASTDWELERSAVRVVTNVIHRRRLESVPAALAEAKVTKHDVIRLALLDVIETLGRGDGESAAEAVAAIGLEPVIDTAKAFARVEAVATLDRWAPAGTGVDALLELLCALLVARQAASYTSPSQASNMRASTAAIEAAVNLAPIPNEADWAAALDHARTKIKSEASNPTTKEEPA